MQEYMIKAEKVIIGDGTVVDDASLLIRGEMIADIGINIPTTPNTMILDFSEHVIMPGIIDTHTHVCHDGMNPDPAELRNLSDEYLAIRGAKFAEQLLQYGVTTFADASSRGNVSFAVRQAIENGFVVGPRMLACGRMLTITGGRDRINGPNEADGIDGTRRATREELARGADFIKLAATGAISSKGTESMSPQFTYEELQVAAEEAHKVGKLAHAHAYGDIGVENTILSGVDVLVHGHPLSERIIQLIITHKTLLMPTLVTYYESYQHHDDGSLPDYMVRKERELVPLIEKGIRNAVKQGIPIVLGSDSGMPYTPFGPSSMKELELLVNWGDMTPMDAIVAATRNAARALNIDKMVGTLEKGKSADLLILNPKINPLNNISVLQKQNTVKRIILKGKSVISR